LILNDLLTRTKHLALSPAISYCYSLVNVRNRPYWEGWTMAYEPEEVFEGMEDMEPFDGFMSDAEADADALASAGWGTDEDYGGYEDDGGWDCGE
jgi:hypothetical protein